MNLPAIFSPHNPRDCIYSIQQKKKLNQIFLMLFWLMRLLMLLHPEMYLDVALFYISISCTFLTIVSIHEIYITFSQQYQTNHQYQMMFLKIPYLEFYKTKTISMWKEYLINLFPKILNLKILNQVCFTNRINNAVEQKTICYIAVWGHGNTSWDLWKFS